MPSRNYFLSSLPMLRFQDSAPLSWERFLAEAKGNISGADYRLLGCIEKGEDGGSSFLKDWNAMNTRLDVAVNTQRKRNLGRTDNSGVVFGELDTDQVAASAMNARNPLEAELVLMHFRYDYLDGAKGFDPFSEAALLAYALQLRILIRKDMFTTKAGNKEFKKLFKKIQEEID